MAILNFFEFEFLSEAPSACIAKRRAGFAKVGIFQIGKNIQAFLDIFRETGSRKLTRKKLINFLKPSFSEEGSNMRLYENAAYRAFSNYIRDVASGRRSGIALGNILQFCAATDEEPLLVSPYVHLFNSSKHRPPPNGNLFLLQIHAARQ